jgi:hypothetical protein
MSFLLPHDGPDRYCVLNCLLPLGGPSGNINKLIAAASALLEISAASALAIIEGWDEFEAATHRHDPLYDVGRGLREEFGQYIEKYTSTF